MGHPDDRRAGFTVLEALVALTILATVVSGILSVFSMSHFLRDRSESQLVNSIHAQALLERAGLDIPLRPGATTGTLDDGRVWMIEIAPNHEVNQFQRQVGSVFYDVRVQVSLPGQTALGVVLRSIRRSTQ